EDSPLLREPAEGPEYVYLLRLVAGHVWETLLLVQKASERESIRAFLDGLPDEARDLHARLLNAAADRHGEAFKTLALVRNKSWHYPEPTDKELRRAVTEHADDVGYLEAGAKMPTIRAVFADEILVSMWTRYSGDDLDALGAIYEHLGELIVAIVHLAQYALE